MNLTINLLNTAENKRDVKNKQLTPACGRQVSSVALKKLATAEGSCEANRSH